MLNDIESNYFPNVLITKDTSRLFRYEREAGYYESWIWSQGVEIHYVIGQSGNPNLDDNVWFSAVLVIWWLNSTEGKRLRLLLPIKK